MSTSKTFLSALHETSVDAREYLAEGADVILSALTDSDALETIPVISIAVKALNVRDAFHKHRLKRNVVSFLDALVVEDKTALEKFFISIQKTPKLADDFSDTAMAVLIDANKPIKCELMGKLLGAASRGMVTPQDLSTLSQIIYTASVPALESIPAFFAKTSGKLVEHGGDFPQEFLLISTGLAGRYGTALRVSELGLTLYKFGFNGNAT